MILKTCEYNTFQSRYLLNIHTCTYYLLYSVLFDTLFWGCLITHSPKRHNFAGRIFCIGLLIFEVLLVRVGFSYSHTCT